MTHPLTRVVLTSCLHERRNFNWLSYHHRFVNRIHQLYRFETIKGSDRRRESAHDRIDERAIFLRVTPLLVPENLMHGTFDLAAVEAFAIDETLHLAGDDGRVMTEHFNAFERKQPTGIG